MKFILNLEGQVESIETANVEEINLTDKKEYTTEDIRTIVKKHNRYERAKTFAIISFELFLIINTILATLLFVEEKSFVAIWILVSLYLITNIICIGSCAIRDLAEDNETEYNILLKSGLI